jgi:hypothetical protein
MKPQRVRRASGACVPNRGCLDHILQSRYAETHLREPPWNQIGMHLVVHEFEAPASSAADQANGLSVLLNRAGQGDQKVSR